MTQPKTLYSINPLKQCVRAHDRGAYILGEQGQRHTTSPLLADILDQLEIPQSEDSLIASLPSHPAAHVYYALNILEKNNIIERDPPLLEQKIAVAGMLIPYDGFDVFTHSEIALDSIKSALAVHGFHPLPDSRTEASQPIRVVLSGDFLCSSSQAQFDFCQNSRIRTLPVKLLGDRSYFGPTLGNFEGVCPDCIWARMQANRPIENYLHVKFGRPLGFNDPSRVGLSDYAGEVAMAVASAIATGSFPRDIVEFGPDGRTVHAVDGLAACARCQSEGNQISALFDWGERAATSLKQGGYRSGTPQDVIAKLAPLVSDLTGLVSAMGPLEFDGAANARHVWAATYPITPQSDTPDGEDFHSTAMGKGVSAAQAQASAICEAMERISAQYSPRKQIKQASTAELEEDAIDPNAVWNFSKAQFHNRDTWNAQTSDTRRHVPAPFDPAQKYNWAPVWSLTEKRQKWMLRELCYINAPHPHYGRFDPNGCAAGMTLEEAALQAMLELVERDCIAIWWYNQLHRPGFDPSQSADPNLRSLAHGFHDQGWDCWLLDLRNDLDIPCFAALARAQSDGRWCIGFGAHFEWQLAAERAMSELAQMFRENGRDGPPPWEVMDQTQSQYLFAHGDAQPQNAPITGAEKLGDLIDWLTQKLAQNNIELLILDQTRPDIGLPVVKTFAPGLRHFWPRLGAGRLFDVPVTMGWLPTAKVETELNSVHLFL